MNGICETLIALGKAMERNDCLDETQWEIMDKLTLTPEELSYTNDRQVNGLIRDIKFIRGTNKLLRTQIKKKQQEVMGEMRERLRSDNIRNMALRELYTCQTGIPIPTPYPVSEDERYSTWIQQWVKEHSK